MRSSSTSSCRSGSAEKRAVGLTVTRLELNDFRNQERFCLEPNSSLTVLVGQNAVGKTSIIEGIELLTETGSFRKPSWGDTVRWGADRALLFLHAEGDGRELTTELEVTAAGRRTYKLNGKVRRRAAEVAGVIPCVTFTPDDLRLVKDAAEKRRASIDAVGVQLSPSFSKIKQDYEKTVRQRNALLKEVFIDEQTMDSWTHRLVDLGARLVTHRRRLFDRMTGPLETVYSQLSGGERLTAKYVPSWERDGVETGDATTQEAIELHLAVKRREELSRRTSLVGPHRDEIAFFIDGRDARTFASQGQQRTIALAWKLAEVSVITDIGAQAPLLLLDDVMSELDEQRRHALTDFVGSAAQTFLTTTNLGYFDASLLDRAAIVELR